LPLAASEIGLLHDRQMGLVNSLGRASGLRTAALIDSNVVLLAQRLFLTELLQLLRKAVANLAQFSASHEELDAKSPFLVSQGGNKP
jgi:hypothetical protein